MTTLLPSIIDMQRHITSEMDVFRRNISKLEESVGRMSNVTTDTAVQNNRAFEIAAASPNLPGGADLAVDPTLFLRELSSKIDEVIRAEQQRSEVTNRTLQDIQTQVNATSQRIQDLQTHLNATSQRIQDLQTQHDGATLRIQDTQTTVKEAYAASHGDHIRIDVLSSNLQEVVAKSDALKKDMEILDTKQTTVNGRLNALEKAVKSVKPTP